MGGHHQGEGGLRGSAVRLDRLRPASAGCSLRRGDRRPHQPTAALGRPGDTREGLLQPHVCGRLDGLEGAGPPAGSVRRRAEAAGLEQHSEAPALVHVGDSASGGHEPALRRAASMPRCLEADLARLRRESGRRGSASSRVEAAGRESARLADHSEAGRLGNRIAWRNRGGRALAARAAARGSRGGHGEDRRGRRPDAATARHGAPSGDLHRHRRDSRRAAPPGGGAQRRRAVLGRPQTRLAPEAVLHQKRATWAAREAEAPAGRGVLDGNHEVVG